MLFYVASVISPIVRPWFPTDNRKLGNKKITQSENTGKELLNITKQYQKSQNL